MELYYPLHHTHFFLGYHVDPLLKKSIYLEKPGFLKNTPEKQVFGVGGRLRLIFLAAIGNGPFAGVGHEPEGGSLKGSQLGHRC